MDRNITLNNQVESRTFMDLQFLFQEPIIEIQELSPGYEDHACDV
ncbi:hypothetical protein EV146_114106 [Mesobacillus foraminis]|uniref:Uncharacterized protein n=1 Tax=Mesobacillus foraminis TaxID=279826 RepID=A0A4R2B2G0_9BACI|nr:hypothetical protein EV146_114106 [Mesobacillus foraminis]